MLAKIREIIATYFETQGNALYKDAKLNMEYPDTISFAFGELKLAIANLCFIVAKAVK